MRERTKRKLLSIIAESSIEPFIIEDLRAMGVKGYTSWEARGEGERGDRAGDWEQNRNVMIQVVCSDSTADKIAERLFDAYQQDYAMVVHVSDVEVMRPQKFT